MNAIQISLVAMALSSSALAETPLLVEIVPAVQTPQILQFSQTGEITARDTLGASFAIGGRVTAVDVDKGDSVVGGMVLARMESVQQEQELRAAQAGVYTADADYRQAQDDFDRQQSLLDRGATTRSARDLAEDNLRIAEGTLAQANSTLSRAQKAVSDTVLLAPSNATVTDRTIEPGQVVGAAQPVLELAIGDELDAVFEISEGLLTTDRNASDVRLTLIDPPFDQFTGQVREVSPLVDQTTGTVTVTVGIIDAPDNATFRDAVRGTVSFEAPSLIVVPYTALSANAQGPAVWIVDQDTMQVTLVNVTLNRFETGQMILSDGVDEGTWVVTKGTQLLYPGRTVRRAEETQ